MQKPIEMPFGVLTLVGPRNHALDGGKDRSNPFAAVRGDKMVKMVSLWRDRHSMKRQQFRLPAV